MIDLKEYTQDLHIKVEGCYFPKKLFKASITKDEYITYLSIFYTLHKTIESQFELYQTDWEKYNFKYQSYFRVDLLLKDLTNLNQTPTYFFTYETTINSFPEAIGYLYVLTGSTMGGKLLSQKVSETKELQDIQSINNYFNGFKENTMEMWGEFMKFLHTYIAINPTHAQLIGDGARRCFEDIIKGLEYGK